MGATDWYQRSLFDVEVIEVRIRQGFVPSQDHVQVLVEMYDPQTGVLIAQASMPHAHIADAIDQLDWAVSRAKDWIIDQVEPF